MSAITCPLIALSRIPSAARTSTGGTLHLRFRLSVVTASPESWPSCVSAMSTTTCRARRNSRLNAGSFSHSCIVFSATPMAFAVALIVAPPTSFTMALCFRGVSPSASISSASSTDIRLMLTLTEIAPRSR